VIGVAVRRRARTLDAVAVACALACWTESAAACDIGTPPGFQIVANPADEVPPSTPDVRTDIRLGRSGGCAGGGDCRDLTFVDFHVGAVDDVSASAELGYLFELSDSPLYGGEGPFVADEAGVVRIYLNGGLEADGPDFDVRVSAVDKAGNVSREPRVVTIRRSGRCQVASDTFNGALWTAVMIGLLTLRRRRHTQRRAARAVRET
jgi:hypothetical protein